MTVLLACGDYPTGSGGTGTHSAGGGFAGNGAADAGGGGAAGAGVGGAAGSGSVPAGCECGPSTCRSPGEVIADECAEVDEEELVTFTEREGCDYTVLGFDHHHGYREEYYDDRGALTFRHADNAFAGGLSVCGVKPECPGAIVFECRFCRGSLFVDDDVPDCPATLR